MGAVADAFAVAFGGPNRNGYNADGSPYAPVTTDGVSLGPVIENAIPNAQDLSGVKAAQTSMSGDILNLYNLVGDRATNEFVDGIVKNVATLASSAFVNEIVEDVQTRANAQVTTSRLDGLVASLAMAIKRSAQGGLRTLPGLIPEAFVNSVDGGDPYAIASLDPAGVVLTQDGFAYGINGSSIVAQREMWAVEPGRVYRVRVKVRRLTDTVDPANDTVRIMLGAYDQGRTTLAPPNNGLIVRDLNTLVVGSGLVEVSALVSTVAETDVMVLPQGTVYARLAVVTFGITGRTAVTVLDHEDVTDGAIWSPDVSGLQAEVNALLSVNSGARIAALEAAVGNPNRRVFLTIGDAKAASLDASIQGITLLNGVGVGDRCGGNFIRATAAPYDFATADGAQWVHSDAVPTLRLLGAKGDGSDATVAYGVLMAAEPEIFVPAGDYLVDVGAQPNPIGKPIRGGGRVLRQRSTGNGTGNTMLDVVNSYVDPMGIVVGREYMWHWGDLIQRIQPIKAMFAGDSVWEGTNVTLRPNELLAAEARRRGFFGMTTINDGHAGKACSEWLSTYLAQDMAQTPDLYIMHWGGNDVYLDVTAGFTVDQAIARFATNLRAGLALIRNGNPGSWPAYDLNGMTIVLVVPVAQLDYTTRDSRFGEALRRVLVQAGRDYGCAVVDMYAVSRDARSSTYMYDTSPDGGHIHPNDSLMAHIMSPLYDLLFPRGLDRWSRTQLENTGGQWPITQPAANNTPDTYDKMMAFGFGAGTAGWPVFGGVMTLRQDDGIVIQYSWGVSGTRPALYVRHGRNDGPNSNAAKDWTAWTRLGQNHLIGCTTAPIGPGKTLYLGCNGAQQFETQSTWFMPADGQVTRLNVKASDSAPGGNESFTYTLMKNGFATSLTLTLTGTAQSGAATGAIDYAAGDTLDIRIVSSAAATPSGQVYSLATA